MKKIPTIFERDPEWPSRLLHAANPECGWVFKGQGVPRRKYDGTSCYVGNGQLYRRREVGLRTILPRGTIIVDYGEVKETVIVWWPVDPSDPQDRWHCEAFDRGPSTESLSAKEPMSWLARRSMEILKTSLVTCSFGMIPHRYITMCRAITTGCANGCAAETSRAWCSTTRMDGWQK